MLFKDHFQVKLNKKISNCSDCILKDNPGPVLGYGDTSADVMFISDAPGKKEVETGVPFTGKAKQKILETIKIADLKKGEYYFTYLIKHSVVGTKSAIEYSRCLHHLLEEIELINPRVICSMGFYSTKALMKVYKMEIDMAGLKAFHGNGMIIPEKRNRGKLVRPMRFLVPTWNPASDNKVIHIYIEDDVLMIKTIRDYYDMLFDSANVSKQSALTTVDKNA